MQHKHNVWAIHFHTLFPFISLCLEFLCKFWSGPKTLRRTLGWRFNAIVLYDLIRVLVTAGTKFRFITILARNFQEINKIVMKLIVTSEISACSVGGQVQAVKSWAGLQGRPQKGPSGIEKSDGPHPFSRGHALLCTAITLLLDGTPSRTLVKT